MLIAKTPAIGSFLSKNPKATTTNERQLVTLKASPPLLYTYFFQLLLYSLERRDFPERSHVPCLQLLSCWILSCYFTDGFILQIQSSLGSDDCEKTLWKENQQHNGPICQLPIHPHHCSSQCCWYCCLVMMMTVSASAMADTVVMATKAAGNCLQHHFQSCFCVMLDCWAISAGGGDKAGRLIYSFFSYFYQTKYS